MENVDNWEKSCAEREARLDNLFAAFRGTPKECRISAMPIVIRYTAIVESIEYFKRGEEPVFRFTRRVKKDSPDEQWEEVPLNAYAIRDEFLRVKTPREAPEFLRKTGVFSPLSDTITWTEFRRWQRFAHLIQEHKMLAAAMNDAQENGECAEVLKALTGVYPSTFFDGVECPTPAMTEFDARIIRENPVIAFAVKEGRREQENGRRELWRWFRQPPCSLEWVPKSQEAEQRVIQKLWSGGAMIEFLLSQEERRPVLFIEPKTTLQAIAAAIYAERIQGVEYRACDLCGALIKPGKRGTKRYCDPPRPCKSTAHKRRMRKAAKERKEALGAKKPKKKR